MSELSPELSGVPAAPSALGSDAREGHVCLAEGQSESRYRALVRASADIVWIVGADGMQANEVQDWQAFTGRSAKGWGWVEAIHPDDRELSVAKWNEAVASGQMFRIEQRLRRQDGVYRSMMVRAVPVRDDEGKLVEWIGTHTDITDQKEAEAKLRLSEARYRSLVRATADIISAGKVDGTEIGDISEWLQFTGFTAEEAADLGWANALHPDDRERGVWRWMEAIASGKAFENEHRLRRKDGVYRHMLARAVPVHDADGKITEWITAHTDVTEQREAEAELARQADLLRASESRFRKLFESDLLGITIPDRFGAFHEGNDEFLRMVGYTREDLEAGKVRWDTMTPAEYAAVDAEHIAEAAERGSCTPYEKEYIRKDGSRLPIRCGYALLEGSQDRYIAFVQDLTPQKKAEGELREREVRFSVLAESLPQLIWVSDTAGRNIYCNRRFEEYTGITVSELLGADWEGLIHPEDLGPTLVKWQGALETGEIYENEYRLRRYDGSYRTFLARAVPVRNEAGQIERWLGSSTDIHDQKLAEDALRRSEKLATAGRLAASMAHEVNNPLAAVVNMVYLAQQDTTLSAGTRRLLEDADQELMRVVQFATQTLRFHRQSVAPAPVDLGEIMDSVLTMYGSRLRGCSARVTREYLTQQKLWCFNNEVRQVFANLIGNSLDALGQEGDLRIRIRDAQDEAGVRGIRVTVADTGAGIPKEIQGRVFEPFVSTKESTGVGLGLWVTRGIVQNHKGRIAFRSRVGGARHGTVFTLFFPLVEPE